jgi:uncharacterized protein YdeI (YjbR/CyaY-like superfamily)
MSRPGILEPVLEPVFFATPAEFRAWLEENHATLRELRVGYYKVASGEPSLTWPESVDQALCFGWIDGVRHRLSDEAYAIRFTPRKPTSIWSAINVARVAELTKGGLMRPAGMRAFAARTAERTGIYSFERNEAAKLSKAQEKLLRDNRKAAAFFDAQPPWYRRTATHWVISAKQEGTRARRLAQLIEDSAAGRAIRSLRRPDSKGWHVACVDRAGSFESETLVQERDARDPAAENRNPQKRER